MRRSYEWIQSLKPGDEVAIVRGAGMGRGAWLHTVERLTKTLVVVDGHKFRKRDGLEPGSNAWGSRRISKPEDVAEFIEETKINEAQSRVRYRVERDYSKLTLDQCEAIRSILEGAEASS